MKSVLITLLMISFLGLSVFSILAMGHDNGHFHGGCIASLVEGVVCNGIKNVKEFLNFHVNAFKSFSEAVFNYFGFAGFLGLAVLILGMLIFSFLNAIPKTVLDLCADHTARFRKYFRDHKTCLNFIEFLGWLALHENSPAYI